MQFGHSHMIMVIWLHHSYKKLMPLSTWNILLKKAVPTNPQFPSHYRSILSEIQGIFLGWGRKNDKRNVREDICFNVKNNLQFSFSFYQELIILRSSLSMITCMYVVFIRGSILIWFSVCDIFVDFIECNFQ